MAIIDMWFKKDGTPKATNGRGKRWQVALPDPRPDFPDLYRANWAGQKEAKSDHAAKVKLFEQVKVSLEEGTYRSEKERTMTLRDALPGFLASIGAGSPKTAKDYAARMNQHVFPLVGDLPVRSLTIQKSEELKQWMMEQGRTPSQMTTAFTAYRSMGNYLLRIGAIDRHPCPPKTITLPKINKEDKIPFTRDELRMILKEIPERLRCAVVLMALGGLRSGEWRGLTLEALDLEEGTAKIDRQLRKERTDDPGLFDAPKCDSSGTIELSDTAVAAIREHLAKFPATRKHEIGWVRDKRKPRPVTFLFVKEDGSPWGYADWQNEWEKLLRRLEWDRTGNGGHRLRHTCASLLIDRGASIVEVAAQLRHKDPATTLNEYAHLMPNRRTKIRSILDDEYRDLI